MSTILLETEEAEPFLSLVQYVAKRIDDKEQAVQTSLADTPGNKLSAKGEQLLQSNDLPGVAKLIIPYIDLIMVQASDDNSSETCLVLLVQLVVRTADSDEAAAIALADELMTALASSTTQRPVLRVQAMLELFNSWPKVQYQHTLLMKILTYGHAAEVSQLAIPLYNKADLWDRAWQLSRPDAMDLFEAISKVLDLHPSPLMKKEAFALQTRVLLSCPADDAKRIASLKSTARAAAIAFIGNPSQYSCDVFATPPVQALKDDPEQAQVFNLLDVVLNGKLASFDSEGFAPVIQEARTTEAELKSKMRLSALLAVCSSKEGQDVPFKAVEEALALEPGEAEGWLVQAFGKQLLEGRINQVQECVTVRRCERRVFSAQDWDKLLGDLEAWKEGLEGLEVTMKSKNLLTPSVTVHPWLSA